MVKIGFLLCEGSSDVQFLNKIITPLPVRIIPTGGKYGAGSFIKGFLESKKVSKPDFYFYYRDRDFDFEPPSDQPELSIKQGGLLVSHRITLENYLISAEQMLIFLSSYKSTPVRQYTLQDLETAIEQAARDIKFYQASRHALGAIRVPIEVKTTWIENGSGTLPLQLDENSCLQQALMHINPQREKISAYTDQKFQEKYQYFIQLFNDTFFVEKKYFAWFQGKDLITSIKRQLPDFPMKSYLNFAMSSFTPEAFPDLLQLKQLIQDNL